MTDIPEDGATIMQMLPEKIGPGSVIEGRYEVQDALGEGGFATVYKAKQAHIGRIVAMKVLSRSLMMEADERFEARFMREAQVAAQIAHPNVVTIFEFGVAGDMKQPYVAMELLDGCDLEQELNERGSLSPRRCIELFQGALGALAVGHAAGITHKDLKPSNLFLTKTIDGRERLKVLDFGIARTADDAGRLSASGEFIGAPQYAAPEYVARQEVTAAVDVYQMGLILVEALTGVPVVDKETSVDCLMAHSRGELNVPTELMQSPLGAVLRKCLGTDPTSRFQNAKEFADALEGLDLNTLEQAMPGMVTGEFEAPAFEEEEDRTQVGTPAMLFDDDGDERDTETYNKSAFAATAGPDNPLPMVSGPGPFRGGTGSFAAPTTGPQPIPLAESGPQPIPRSGPHGPPDPRRSYHDVNSLYATGPNQVPMPQKSNDITTILIVGVAAGGALLIVLVFVLIFVL